MKVIILAAGIGTRLRPLTYYIPKSMLPLGGRPALEYIITYLKKYNHTDIVIALSYLADNVTNYFQDGQRFGVNITYSTSEHPRGTAGEVYNARELLDGPFICYYGDIITDLDLNRLTEYHEKKGGIATVALVKNVPIEVGVAELNSDNTITEFKEKPPLNMPVNTGIYVFQQRILDYLEDRDPLDFGFDVFPKLIGAEEKIYGCIFEDAFWYDLGTLRRYEELEKQVKAGKLQL